MIKFLSFAAKLQLNVHDLNNEAVAGNVTDIRIMEFLKENGEKDEAPAVSGRMLKHWHYEAMRKLGLGRGLKFCDGCKNGEPIRPGKMKENNLVQESKSEEDAITNCCICDIHGYLIAKGAKGEKETGTSARRTSRVLFSWLMPALEGVNTQKQVIHTRVSQQEKMAEGESASQMIFNKSYASGIYAFVSVLDVERIGLIELNLGKEKYAIKDNERRERIKVAIEAYRYLISGQLGASLSHALPHTKIKEFIAIYSEKGPLPFPVSPIYKDYLKKTIDLLPENANLLFFCDGESKEGITVKSIDEIFKEILSKV